jgi:hypothetical protein
MAFAIFYNDQDTAVLAGTVSRGDLTNQERQFAQKCWNGGLRDWATAPFALSTCDDPSTFPVTSHRVVISAQGVTKQQFADFLRNLGTRLGDAVGGYLTTLALDVEQCGVEPWPPLGGEPQP